MASELVGVLGEVARRASENMRARMVTVPPPIVAVEVKKPQVSASSEEVVKKPVNTSVNWWCRRVDFKSRRRSAKRRYSK